MPKIEKAVELLDIVSDRVTGFTGTVVALTTWAFGVKRAGIQTAELINGVPQDLVWVDVPQLKIVHTKIKRG